MGRPSKLTEKQWDELGERLLKGEKAADLSREYGVSKAVISNRFSKRTKTVKDVANQIVAAESALRALPLSEQVSTISLVDQLRSMTHHMMSGANYSAATFHRLSGIANMKLAEVDDAAPLTAESREALKDVAVVQRMANEAAHVPLNVMAGSKEAVKSMQQQDGELQPVQIVVQVEDASVPEPEAQ